MGILTDLANEVERRYLPSDGTGVGSHSPPEQVERLVTTRALCNSVRVLEAVDDTTDDADNDRRLLAFYGMMAAAYTLDAALNKIAVDVLGSPFPNGQGVDLSEFGLVRRLITHPVDLRVNAHDRGHGVAPQGAFIGEGVAHAETQRPGYLITVVQSGYEWKDNKYRPIFPFEYLAVLKANLEKVYLPRLIAGLPDP